MDSGNSSHLKNHSEPTIQNAETEKLPFCIVPEQNVSGSYQQNKERNRTLYVSYFTIFIFFVGFSITLSSQWPYLKEIDGNVKETYFGIVNAMYCFSQFLSSIVFGYWKDKRKASEPIYFSIILLFIGYILYMYANSFGTKGVHIVLIARCLLGLSGGNIAVVRAIGAEYSTKENRAKVMAFVSFSQAFGVFVGPLVQASVKPVGRGVYVPGIMLHLNLYTVPCILMLFFGVVLLFLQYFYFKEFPNVNTEDLDVAKGSCQSKVDMIAVLLLIFFWFTTSTIFTVSEIIVSPTTINEFGMTKKASVFYTSIILGADGAIALTSFLAVIPLSKRLNDRLIILAGYLLMLAGVFLLLPWGPKQHMLTSKNSNNTDDAIGCPYEYLWCHDTPAIALPQFLVGLFIAMVGFSFNMVTVKILLSNVIGPFPQGRYMGWYSAAGAVSRSIAPIYISTIYQYFGLRWSSVGFQVLLIITLAFVGCYWKRLVPYGEFKSDRKSYKRL